MPAYIRREPALLLVTFESDGEEPEQQLARTGERALKTALLMLAKRDELRHGDTLTVRRADEDQSTTVLQGPWGDLPADTTERSHFAPAGAVRARPYLHFATRMEIRQAVAAGEMADREAHELMRSYVLPTRPLPVVGRIGGAFIPAIYDPTISAEWLRFERFPRKAKATEHEALAYAAKVIAWREHFADYKRRRREAVDPRLAATIEGRAA